MCVPWIVKETHILIREHSNADLLNRTLVINLFLAPFGDPDVFAGGLLAVLSRATAAAL